MAGESNKQGDLIRQIAQAWDAAQSQLRDLRRSVERTSELAQAHAESAALLRERERALRDFGEALWGEVKRGQLDVPPAAERALRMLELVERKALARSASITALLQASEQVVAPKPPARRGTKETKALAARPKKR